MEEIKNNNVFHLKLLEEHDKVYDKYKAIEFYQYSLFGYLLGKQLKINGGMEKWKN